MTRAGFKVVGQWKRSVAKSAGKSLEDGWNCVPRVVSRDRTDPRPREARLGVAKAGA